MPVIQMTDKALQAAKVDAGRLELWDSQQSGLVLRVTAAGIKTWSFVYRFRGVKGRLRLGHYPGLALADARRQARDKQTDIDDGIDPTAERRRDRQSWGKTFAALVERYEAEGKTGKQWAEVKRALRLDVLPAWRDRLVREITRRDVRAIVRQKSKTAPVMANRLLSYVNTLFTFALRELDDEEWLDGNPAAAIGRNEERPRDRWLSNGELAIVWPALITVTPKAATKRAYRDATLRSVMCEAFVMLLLTGQRLGEVTKMEWAELDLRAGRWLIPAHKAKDTRGTKHHPHLVPLTATTVARLRALQDTAAAGARFVFSTNGGQTHIYARAKKFAAKLSRELVAAHGAAFAAFTAHALRHTVITHMAEIGIDERLISRVMNHKAGDRENVTRRHYNHFKYEAEKRSALEAWERKLERAITHKTADVVTFASSAPAPVLAAPVNPAA
jgi:integrase